MTFQTFRAHFEANRGRPVPPVTPPALPEAQRALLASSLARFQLGETGEGRIASQIDRVQLPGVDADYRAALKLFVAEEGRHAGILARMVNALNGRLLGQSGSHYLFLVARRLIGVRFKLLVMLAAEVIAVGFYGLLAGALPESELKDALGQVGDDERAHFDFHCAFLRQQSLALRLCWWPLALASALTVLIDHRATLRGFGISMRAAWAELHHHIARGARALQGAPACTQLIKVQSSSLRM
ncbi:MAG: ferritin-like domain-containing protein [Archangiaceae bacterium]|nr:ferritin-like domain-containing protein [Archangiaceae bacterium]